MHISIIGGTGFETVLLTHLKGHYIRLIGAEFDLAKKSFPDLSQQSVDFIPEFFTHKNISILNKSDVIIEVSENFKSKFVIDDYCHRNNIPAIYLFYQDGWNLFVQSSDGIRLNQLINYEKHLPPICLPAPPIDTIINRIVEAVANLSSNNIASNNIASYIISLSDNKKTDITQAQTESQFSSESFIYGEVADIISISCGEESVGITPTDDVLLDLPSYAKILKDYVEITKISPFYIEFKIAEFECMLFRQCRLTVKPTKSETVAYAIFRRYVGS